MLTRIPHGGNQWSRSDHAGPPVTRSATRGKGTGFSIEISKSKAQSKFRRLAENSWPQNEFGMSVALGGSARKEIDPETSIGSSCRQTSTAVSGSRVVGSVPTIGAAVVLFHFRPFWKLSSQEKQLTSYFVAESLLGWPVKASLVLLRPREFLATP